MNRPYRVCLPTSRQGSKPVHTGVRSGMNYRLRIAEFKDSRYDGSKILEVFSKSRDYLKISKEKEKRMQEAL